MSSGLARAAAFAVVVAVPACPAGEHSAAPRQPAGGRLVLGYEPSGRPPLLDVAASATYCEADSTVAVVALARGWVGAVALRTRWPLADSSWFQLHPGIGPAGTAALALRPVADSIGRAMISASGRLTVGPGAVLTGRIEALLGGPGDSARVAGRLENVPVRQACPPPP